MKVGLHASLIQSKSQRYVRTNLRKKRVISKQKEDEALSITKLRTINEKRITKDCLCSICRTKLGLKDCVIISCSHVFHAACLQSLESFLGFNKRKCPVCRKSNYEKDNFEHPKQLLTRYSSTLIQRLLRMFLVEVKLTKRVDLGTKTMLSKRLRKKMIWRNNRRVNRNLSKRNDEITKLLNSCDLTLKSSKNFFKKNENSFQNEEYNFWVKVKHEFSKRNDINCSICLSKFVNELALLSCTHAFHIECLSTFENVRSSHEGITCPICRSPFVSKVCVQK